jgi:hypothetical protein
MIKITKEYINNLFNNNNIVTKKIIIENQEQIKNKLNLCDYLNNNTKRSIHGKKRLLSSKPLSYISCDK